MEQNLPVITKRVWSIVRALLFMMRKGIFSKKKFMVDLNMVLKRGKIAGAKAIGNLMFHHHHRQVSPKCSMDVSTAAVAKAAVQEYEFSCSNTPNYTFPFNLAAKKKNGGIQNYYHHFFGCAHAPPTHEDDMVTMNAVKVVLEMLNNNDNTMMEATVAASPMLPGFGQTPLARQLRITDSPFPLRDVDEDNGYVDKAAEDFINRFYKDLRQQDKRLSEL
ncbi:hypothetical protein Goshw_017945 [Gossypium schwendimanii]|uniref:Avr9/Cf-9 rapidly elicited protein 146 n=3 Tax=Gossypium TaxID=3633 RepID=A0A7J9MIR1_GOSSC|nr:hypothetical protein [Gossypium lobatum]MBA0695706.1 hypothetical protein [Gossypium aridum]MBA0870851.1 hypothetical protein [Gossypium schwendimanii]